jgi:hypothetical protein
MFMPYPWPIMTIVDPPVDASGAYGMEYPTLVTAGYDSVWMRPGIRIPEYVTVHEVGHNWFQGVLASNEVDEAWLDEGVNEWADAIVMRDLYGARANGADWLGWQADTAAIRKAFYPDPGTIPAPIASASYAFPDGEAYDEATYGSTARAFETLEAEAGSAKLLAAMKTYARTFAFKHPTGRDLFTTLENELGDIGWFVGAFEHVGGSDLDVRSAGCERMHPARGVFGDTANRKTMTEAEAPDTGTYVCDIVIQNTGTIHVPVDIELSFADGSTQRVRWDDRGSASWERFHIERSSELTEVNIDPDRKLALAIPTTHHVRVLGDGSAALRAAARVSSWAQLLMQLVGP